ncbi:exported hypothetical protein [metagenome]|uniref:Uncharacterized protein n=1 Tax=metagenome TaxID=256318 RepID=A0A2P2CK59_9ZZZZ
MSPALSSARFARIRSAFTAATSRPLAAAWPSAAAMSASLGTPVRSESSANAAPCPPPSASPATSTAALAQRDVVRRDAAAGCCGAKGTGVPLEVSGPVRLPHRTGNSRHANQLSSHKEHFSQLFHLGPACRLANYISVILTALSLGSPDIRGPPCFEVQISTSKHATQHASPVVHRCREGGVRRRAGGQW